MQTAPKYYAPTRPRLRLPPFAGVSDWRDDMPVRIHVGPQAWEIARFEATDPFDGFWNVLALPPGHDAAGCRWPVHSKRVRIKDTGADRDQVERLVVVLHEWGADQIVVYWHQGIPQMFLAWEADRG